LKQPLRPTANTLPARTIHGRIELLLGTGGYQPEEEYEVSEDLEEVEMLSLMNGTPARAVQSPRPEPAAAARPLPNVAAPDGARLRGAVDPAATAPQRPAPPTPPCRLPNDIRPDDAGDFDQLICDRVVEPDAIVRWLAKRGYRAPSGAVQVYRVARLERFERDADNLRQLRERAGEKLAALSEDQLRILLPLLDQLATGSRRA
jgi:hypothetical protein